MTSMGRHLKLLKVELPLLNLAQILDYMLRVDQPEVWRGLNEENLKWKTTLEYQKWINYAVGSDPIWNKCLN
jgi:hypothetical protein